MNRKLCLTLVVVLLLSGRAIAQSSDAQYQQGKILEVRKLQSHQPPAGGTADASEAPLRAGVDMYNIKIQVGDTLYTCRHLAQSGTDVSWMQEQTREVRVKSDTIFVKRSIGGEAQCPIVGKEQVKQP
jgi:hypothetical protein